MRPGDLVVDVGAGSGRLTALLLEAGARVIAVELHPERARLLRLRFGSAVIVVQADASDLRLPRQPFRVVANPPFAVSTGLLRRLLTDRSRMVSADLVLPAHTAARWVAGRAPASARWRRHYSARVITRLPPRAFRPEAPMPTAVLRLERHGQGAADPNAPCRGRQWSHREGETEPEWVSRDRLGTPSQALSRVDRRLSAELVAGKDHGC